MVIGCCRTVFTKYFLIPRSLLFLKPMSSTSSKSFSDCKVSPLSKEERDEEVLFQNIDDKGIITLNRPKVLNSLNLRMVRKIFPVLKEWEQSKNLVIIKGVGEKAFCAGGDVKALAEDGLQGGSLCKIFFKEEYTLNHLIGTYHIPYIAFIDGITMGGGVGLSVHGTYRVATERTVFAMPEMTIGLFPDVGGSYFLPRLGGKLGLFLALTGERLKGEDVLKAGIATHYVESSNLKSLEADLVAGPATEEKILKILKQHSKDPSKMQFSLEPNLDKINKIFNACTVENIIENLENDKSNWSKDILKKMEKMSPTSLKICKKELDLGSDLSMAECFKMEYRLGFHSCEGHDFFEGVRALLIDKDQKPKWYPKNLEDVSDVHVDKFFCALEPCDELQL